MGSFRVRYSHPEKPSSKKRFSKKCTFFAYKKDENIENSLTVKKVLCELN